MKKYLIVALLFLLAWSPNLGAQSSFYEGKTITIIVGTKAGDAYDLYARVLAQYLPKYIPGNPNVIVQNLAGAGSRIAANRLYNVAKPDGLTLGSIFPALYFDQLTGVQEVQFDWRKFIWIGSPVKSNHFLYMRKDAPYKNMEDVRKASEPPKCGATGTASTAYYVPKLLEETIGAKFNIVMGYQAGADIDLAVERNEVVCRAFTITAYFAREPFHTWRKNGFVRELMQTGRKRDERLKDAPTIYELMDQYKTPEAGRRLAAVVLAAGDVGRPIVGAPGIPEDRVKILREAFTKMWNDPEVVADAKKKKLEVDFNSGEELAKLAKEVIDQPPEVIESMRKLLGK